ncbi:uncharacterized protein [Choristoneura fumiferana]|uniref:uncharacterized protein n=1 Tax=Choristoneura fumiferana TaxID=7141 RepID=UPI003D15C520
MGKKRKHDESEEEIRRKILKLQDKLAKTTNERERYSPEENLNEKLKAAKTIQQSGKALKNAPKPKLNRPNIPSTIGNKGNLNFVPQHRKTDTKTNSNRRATTYSQRQLPHNSSVRRPNDRAPPSSRTAGAHHRK